MAKAPLYTVVNTTKEPQLVKFAGRAEPIDVGRDKVLPLTPEDAVRIAGEGFKVTGPDGERISARREVKAADKAA
jgi:hypothetical protein